jgi:glycosyltransferase involved in cell wall biosynthesis
VYRRAAQLAEQGDHQQARALYEDVLRGATDSRLGALVRNDIGVLLTLAGDLTGARATFGEALSLDPTCEPARANLTSLDAEPGPAEPCPEPLAVKPPAPVLTNRTHCKVALVSFLFNWPSTGGGIVHTVELAHFLRKAGYDVCLFYPRYEPWQMGEVTQPLSFPNQPLDFDQASWTQAGIQARYRQAVDAFRPDYVLLTDSWNMKPVLAEAVSHYPYILRLQAMECVCPLNNVRFLSESEGRFRQCRLHQLAHVDACRRCLLERGQSSGSLHQAERALAGVENPDYHPRLLQVLRGAEAVLVVNPLTEVMLAPYTRSVRVVTSGMDPARFPWPWADDPARQRPSKPLQIFFAGLVQEGIKGFHVLMDACALLWQKRQDFEVVATGDPVGQVNHFTRFVGWLSQEELPRHLRAADLLVMPTIAQEALGRTAVEAMGVGRPVIASRLGGLPFTVRNEVTGLLFEPGNPADLACKLEILFDRPELRLNMGEAGRKLFEEHYTWDVIIERHYRPLLVPHDAKVAQPDGGSA